MSGLPFVVQPKCKPITEYVGSEESGQIAIERRGYLSSGEKAFVQQALGVDETSIRVIGLSRKVAASRKMELNDAYQKVIGIVSGQLSGDEECSEIEAEYFDDFNDLLSHLANVQSKEQLLKALCMVQYRINPNLGVSDVLDLHPDIINGLVELYNDEEMRSTERLMAAEEVEREESEELEVEKVEKKSRSRATRAQ